MYKNFFFGAFCLILVFGCGSSVIMEFDSSNTSEQLILGSIGSAEKSLLGNDFNSSALPNYDTPIKISVQPKIFNKQAFKKFKEAEELQAATIELKYVDSIPDKPKYLELELFDKVRLISLLNSSENSDVKHYLSLNANAPIISNVSIAFNTKELEKIMKAKAVFLKHHGYKTYVLQLFNKENKEETIWFNEGVIFKYNISHCCWQENYKHDTAIVDIVSQYDNCPNKTYRSSIRAKKKSNHYKL